MNLHSPIRKFSEKLFKSMILILPSLCLSTTIFPTQIFAQKQAYIWNCGFGLRLNFSTGTPVFEPGSNIYAPEGCASYSDKNGNLLFYTSGDTFIYNANNQVMFDMGNTGGNFSAMQSSVIIEAPCEPGKYYLFTMDGFDPTQSNNGLCYFKIDMSLNGGLGGVVQPGVSLYANTKEGLCAVRAKNKTDYFILINHTGIGIGVYKVTSAGISLHNVFNYPPSGTRRVIKASPDGSKVFVLPDPDGSNGAQSSQIGVLLDFNNDAGVLSNPQILSSLFYQTVGTACTNFNYFEFSPNSRYLYLATCNAIQRLDLQNGQTTANVIFDMYNWTISGGISQLQLGPDGNIYFCFYGQLLSNGQVVTELSRIRCPNLASPIIERILTVPNGYTFGAMPNYPSWLFEAKDSCYVSLGPDTLFLCDNNGSITLNAMNPGASYQWSNGSTAQSITVNTPGLYKVIVNGSCGIGRDSVVIFNCHSEIITTPDVCSTVNVPFTFLSPNGISTIQWNFGDNASGNMNTSQAVNTQHTFSSPGSYTVTAIVTTPCSLDTFSRTLSFGGFISSINASSCGAYTAPWGTQYMQSGVYADTLVASNGCDSIRRVNLTINQIPSATATSTPSTCGQNNGTASVNASGGSGTYTYLWSNGTSGLFNTGLAEGSYTVVATDQNGCSAQTQVNVGSIPPANVLVTASDTLIQFGDSVLISVQHATDYSWTPQTGLSCSNCSTLLAKPVVNTTYFVTGKDTSGCAYSRSVTIVVEINCTELFVPDVFSPNGIDLPENEKVCVYSNCIKEMTFAIYNRWGELIYLTNDSKACWDGTHKGTPSPAGVYAYRLYVEQRDGQKVEKAGYISLVR